MKKINAVVIGLLFAAGAAFAGNQPQSIGLVRVQISSAPLALINNTTPLGAYELIGCTNCVQAALCISTGTGPGAYVVAASSHSIGTNPSLVPCR